MAERKSLQEIAATMLQPVDDAQGQPTGNVTPNEGNAEPEGDVLEDQSDEGQADEADDQSDDDQSLYEGDGDADADEGDGDDEEEDGSDDDAGTDGVIDINDDDLIEVKIDGEIQYRSIAEAKQALSGEGAYHKRVQEATELRKQAQAERTQMLERFSEASNNFNGVLQELDKYLFRPSVEKPAASLKQQNPDLYYRKMAEYQAEQDTLNEGRQQLTALAQKQQETLKQQRDEYRKEQARLLEERLPSLRDQQAAPALVNSMIETAKEYGFTDEELNSALDHRYYLMVADLAKYRGKLGAKDRKANTVKNLDGQQNKRPRKLRSGAAAAKAKVRQQQNREKSAMDAARKSGRVKDIAATLIKKG